MTRKCQKFKIKTENFNLKKFREERNINMFKVRDLISKKIDTEFWLEEDKDKDAIFLKTKLTNESLIATVARIDKNGILIFEGFYKDFGFKTVNKENGRSSINVYYSFVS